jgi:hypothetical protein
LKSGGKRSPQVGQLRIAWAAAGAPDSVRIVGSNAFD